MTDRLYPDLGSVARSPGDTFFPCFAEDFPSGCRIRTTPKKGQNECQQEAEPPPPATRNFAYVNFWPARFPGLAEGLSEALRDAIFSAFSRISGTLAHPDAALGLDGAFGRARAGVDGPGGRLRDAPRERNHRRWPGDRPPPARAGDPSGRKPRPRPLEPPARPEAPRRRCVPPLRLDAALPGGRPLPPVQPPTRPRAAAIGGGP
jgi:hypothetical protein